jgi:magnesium chelatase family protein
MIRHASSKQQWSNCVQIKIIRLARTISDLDGSQEITDEPFGRQSLYAESITAKNE